MRVLIAAVIAVSVCSLQAQTLAFHVHAAAEHVVDGGHAHGPAIHQHQDDEPHHDTDVDRDPHMDADDASSVGTVITIAIPAGTAPAAVPVDAEFTETLPVTELQILGDARAIDVRSHGPPPRRSSLLRGPPALALL